MKSLSHLINKFQRIPAAKSSFFISFEGIEGCGKSTQIKMFEAHLKKQGYEVHLYREPGGTQFGENLRQAILDSQEELHSLAEAHLFASSRAQLLANKILPLLKKEKTVVLLDRYIDSSLCYQGVGRNLGIDTILEIHQHGPLCLLPHATFYLEISLKTSFDRQSIRGNKKDYFESQNEEFYHKLLQGYQDIAQLFPSRIHRINAEGSTNEVQGQILEKWKEIKK